MAGGEWVKQFVYLENDPKVIFAAQALSRDKRFLDWLGCRELSPAVLADVTEALLSRALRVTWGVTRRDGVRDGEDVVLHFATLATLDRVARLPGFGDALASVGWVVAEEGDSLRFPKLVQNIVSPEERRREDAAERKRQQRDRDKQATAQRQEDGQRDGSCDVSHGRHSDVTPTEQNRTEQDNKKEEEPPTPLSGGLFAPATPEPAAAATPKKPRPAPTAWDGTLPADLDRPDFRAAWERWEADRKARRSGLTPEARRLQWAFCVQQGIPAAIACVEQSIAHGWKGLFECGRKAAPGGGPSDRPRDGASGRRSQIEALHKEMGIPTGGSG